MVVVELGAAIPSCLATPAYLIVLLAAGGVDDLVFWPAASFLLIFDTRCDYRNM